MILRPHLDLENFEFWLWKRIKYFRPRNAYNRQQSPVILENFLENVSVHTSTGVLKFLWFKERLQ